MTSDIEFTPLEPGEPRTTRAGGIRGGSRKTRFYRAQLQQNPGKWFIWKKKSPHGTDTGQALRTLVGTQSLTGIDRSSLDYEATSQKQDDGTYTTFVRFTGGAQNADDFEPLAERQSEGTDAAVANDVVSNPFGVAV